MKNKVFILLLAISLLITIGCTKPADEVKAPAGLTYSVTSAIYTKDGAILPNTPTVNGSGMTYSISPALPDGLTINSGTGVISGTPTAVQSSKSYTVTATNSTGSTTATISIIINYAAPTALSYPVTSAVYTKDGAILPNTPTVNGSGLTFTVSPALPAGLSMDAATGEITGTPTAVQASKSYSVTATNSGGYILTSISITINYAAPTGLSYPVTSAVYTKDGAILPNTPTANGSAITFSVSPDLPAGLTLNTETGEISGTPTAVQTSKSYSVTATNSGGSISTSISITINYAAPTGLSYPITSAVYTKDGTILTNTPTVNGSAIIFTVSPELPAGLTLNTTTGAISGTPSDVQSAKTYEITATNTGGSVSATISITINYSAPTGLSYPVTTAVYTKDGTILPLTPTVTGSAITFSASPGLPAGLTLNTTTGIITGAPSAVQAADSYTITATNTGGSISTTISITVNNDPPSELTYTVSTAVYTVNSAITSNTPTVNGSGITFSVSPALPGGLSLNSTTGVITGTPDSELPAGTYTVTAANGAGSTSIALSITVNYAAPTGLTYSDTIAGYATDTLITANNPTVTGSGITFTVSPALPSGLALNSVTGIISGTPSTQQQKIFYTITAANSGGSTTAVISIAVFNKNRTFKAVKVTDSTFYDVPSTLMAVGKYCALYLEDAQSAKCNAATATAICNEFDNNIYNKIITNFASESDVDHNGRIIIFLLDIIDGYSGSGGYVAGFFNPINEFAIGTQPNSNEADMLFMDVNPAVPASSSFYSTIAHEFQHLVNFNSTYLVDGNEQDLWINEGLSSAAEYVYAGAQVQSKIDYYNADPLSTIRYGNNFFVWNGYWENRSTNPDMLANYSTVYLFFQWLRIHSSNGTGIYKEILSSSYRDYRAVTNTASSRISFSFGTWSTLLRTWYEANLLGRSSGYQGYKGQISLTARYFSNTGGADNLFSPGEGIFTLTSGGYFLPPSGSGLNIRYVGINTTTGVEDTVSLYYGNIVLSYNANTNISGSDETGYLPSIVNPNYDFGYLRSVALSKPLPTSYPIDVNFNSVGKIKPESHKLNNNTDNYENKFVNPKYRR